MTELLQRLTGALPRIEHWVDDLRADHWHFAIPVSQAGFSRLAENFPIPLLGDTRVAYVTRIPFPPVAAYGLPEFQEMADMPMAGITFRDMYFIDPTYSAEGIHFHEMVHVVQWQTLGVRAFLLTYALGILQYGYEQSPLEAIAFECQAAFERAIAIPSVADAIVRHALHARDEAATVFQSNGLKWGA